MLPWILGALALSALVAAVYAVATAGPKARAREMRRKRFHLPESAERIGLAPERATEAVRGVVETPAPAQQRRPRRPDAEGRPGPVETHDPRPAAGSMGRLVETPDGEASLTTPPFQLREAIFSNKSGRYVAAIYRRVPPWVMVCPKVRLDSLLIPTPPDGRDAEDWRTWRQRVRVRSIDLVLCDRRTWRPMLAIIIDHSAPDTHALGGGRDRIVDEVLGAVGLPFIRGTGRFVDDWPRIRPYVEQAILPAAEDAPEAADEARRARPGGAVALLRMDEQKGWLLE